MRPHTEGRGLLLRNPPTTVPGVPNRADVDLCITPAGIYKSAKRSHIEYPNLAIAVLCVRRRAFYLAGLRAHRMGV